MTESSMASTRYLEALKSSPFFGLLNESLLLILAEILNPRVFDPGETILEQGRQPDGVHLLMDGELEVLKDENLIATDSVPGSILGEMAIIFDEKRFATVKAKTTVKTLFFPLDLFRELFDMYEALKVEVTQQARQRRFKIDPQMIKTNRDRLSKCRNRVLSLKLKNLSFFKQIQSQFLDELASQLERVRVEEGKILIQQGEPGDAMYVISRGSLEAKDVDTGKVYRVMEPGDMFGELALLQDGPRTAQVTATSKAELYKLNKADFQNMISREPAVASVVAEIASQREFASGNFL